MLDLSERGRCVLFALVVALAIIPVAACSSDGGASERGDTLAVVSDRGELKCGVKQTQPLFGFKEADGSISGFDA